MINLYTWKITKYDPIYMNDDGTYKNDEWTSIGDIGKIFKGTVFNFELYKQYEDAYIKSLLLIMDTNDVTFFQIHSLEKRRQYEYPDMPKKQVVRFIHKLKNEMIVLKGDIDLLLRLILREIVWCKLTCEQSMFVHFGYDYYMYVGCNKKLVNEIDEIKNMGLFPVEMQSPYSD